jgi:hypothetical protein
MVRTIIDAPFMAQTAAVFWPISARRLLAIQTRLNILKIFTQ